MYGAAVQHSTWRLDGMVLPDGEAVETHWVVAGLFTTTAPKEKDVPNLPGRYVLPGLVDAHAHVTIDYTGARRPHGDADVVSTNLSRAVDSGVLDLRDLGAPTGHKAPQGGGDSPTSTPSDPSSPRRAGMYRRFATEPHPNSSCPPH